MYKRIRKAREDLGYTREVFAEKLDVSVSYLAEVERGRTGISVKLLRRMCSVLGISADYLLFGDTYEHNQLSDMINRLSPRYYPLLEVILKEMLLLSNEDMDYNSDEEISY